MTCCLCLMRLITNLVEKYQLHLNLNYWKWFLGSPFIFWAFLLQFWPKMADESSRWMMDDEFRQIALNRIKLLYIINSITMSSSILFPTNEYTTSNKVFLLRFSLLKKFKSWWCLSNRFWKLWKSFWPRVIPFNSPTYIYFYQGLSKLLPPSIWTALAYLCPTS